MTAAVENQKGFTLLEVLIALTLFAVGLLGVAALQIRAIDFNSGANTRSVATSIAKGVLEEVLARDSGDAVFQTGLVSTPWDLDPDTLAESITVPGAGTFTAEWKVDANRPVAKMARVTVTVRTTVKGVAREVSLTGDKRLF